MRVDTFLDGNTVRSSNWSKSKTAIRPAKPLLWLRRFSVCVKIHGMTSSTDKTMESAVSPDAVSRNAVSRAATGDIGSKQTYWFAGVAVLFAIALSIAQNLKLLPKHQGMSAYWDLFPGNLGAGIASLLLVVAVSAGVAYVAKKFMGSLIACSMASVAGACGFLAYEPAMGALVGILSGSIVASIQFRKGILDSLTLIMPPLVVGVFSAIAWRDLDSPFRFAGPFLCGLYLVGFLWWRWPLRIGLVIPLLISASILWLGLTLDTIRRAPTLDCLVWTTNPRTRWTSGLLDLEYVWGSPTIKQLHRLRSYGNIRNIGLSGTSKSAGIDLSWLKNPASVVHMTIDSSSITPAAAESMRHLVGLQRLWIWNSRISPNSLSSLEPMTRLSHLTLHLTDVSDDELRHLVKIPSLSRLDLQQTPITDTGLENLRGHPGLMYVNLSGTDVNGAGIPALVAGQLEIDLNLRKTKLIDDFMPGFVALNQIPIVNLDLSDTDITDEALTYLASIKTLADLKIAGTSITDEGLEYLVNLASLKALDVSETKCTEKGIREIEKALPNLDVSFHDMKSPEF